MTRSTVASGYNRLDLQSRIDKFLMAHGGGCLIKTLQVIHFNTQSFFLQTTIFKASVFRILYLDEMPNGLIFKIKLTMARQLYIHPRSTVPANHRGEPAPGISVLSIIYRYVNAIDTRVTDILIEVRFAGGIEELVIEIPRILQ